MTTKRLTLKRLEEFEEHRWPQLDELIAEVRAAWQERDQFREQVMEWEKVWGSLDHSHKMAARFQERIDAFQARIGKLREALGFYGVRSNVPIGEIAIAFMANGSTFDVLTLYTQIARDATATDDQSMVSTGV